MSRAPMPPACLRLSETRGGYTAMSWWLLRDQPPVSHAIHPPGESQPDILPEERAKAGRPGEPPTCTTTCLPSLPSPIDGSALGA